MFNHTPTQKALHCSFSSIDLLSEVVRDCESKGMDVSQIEHYCCWKSSPAVVTDTRLSYKVTRRCGTGAFLNYDNVGLL